MKAITLIQPWATLIILGEKKIETRSWSTNLRGEIVIHAGRKIDKSVFEKPYYHEVFQKYGITPDNIITSSIIGKCKILDVKKTEDIVNIITEKERAFGNYEPERYGWILGDFEAIEPIKGVRGMLGLWNYNLE